MSGLRVILSGISIAIVAVIAIGIGINGLKNNFKGDKLIQVKWKNIVTQPGFYINKYVQIDSVYTYDDKLQIGDEKFITALAGEHYDSLEVLQHKLGFFAKTNGVSEHEFVKNLTGLVRYLREEVSSVELKLMESGSEEILPKAILIDTLESPRKWYWNTLLILGPLVFISLFAKAIYHKLKGETI
jgi:hypothetical protein